jgi:retron-type reverse transcriptase
LLNDNGDNMTTWTTEDRQNASPPHIVDSGASIKTLADFIEHETSVEKMRKHIDMLGKEILRLQKENAQLKREVEGLMDGRC